jgi:UDP-N-acetylmuramyl pentapeptide phosphotransferase/UDP-N-acetylglucosamine-1-phosphate transferase
LSIELVGAALIALLASFAACGAQIESGPVDLPDAARKAHRQATPTSGGMGVGIGFAVALIALSLFSRTVRHEMTSVGVGLLSLAVAFAYAFMVIGFIDDARPIGPRLKFVLFSACATGAVLVIGPVTSLPIGFGVTLSVGAIAGVIGSALWIFTLVNCVNFMDGSNGLAMGSVAIGLTSLGVIAYLDGSPAAASMSLSGAGALAGFLFWNFPRARLFAGDSGALFAGAIAALASLIAIHRADLSPFAPAIIFFPLLADALLTLAWRARRRRSLLEGHSEHLYQIALRAGWSHTRVALAYWLAMAVCGAIAFAVTRAPDSPAPWIALGALAGLSLLVSSAIRRYAVARNIAEL